MYLCIFIEDELCVRERGSQLVDDGAACLAGGLVQLQGAPLGEQQLPFEVDAQGEHTQHFQAGHEHRARLVHGGAALAGIAGKAALGPLPSSATRRKASSGSR